MQRQPGSPAPKISCPRTMERGGGSLQGGKRRTCSHAAQPFSMSLIFVHDAGSLLMSPDGQPVGQRL